MYAKDQVTIIDRREMLRIKLINLMQEAKLIRAAERATHGTLRFEMWEHRTSVVRAAARHTHLAYGFIRGKRYEQMEQPGSSTPDWEAVRKMVKKYGPKGFVEPECMRAPLKLAA